MAKKKRSLKNFVKWFLVRLPLVLIVAVVFMIIALKLVERYPDPLREGFEEYLTNISGANATIGHLDKITFFPNIDVSLRDITIHDKSNAAIIDIAVETAHISAPFWSMLIGGRRINDISVKNLMAIEGKMTPLSIALDFIKIEDRKGPNQYGSFLVVSGSYGGKKLLLEIEIKKSKKGYIVPEVAPFSLTLGRSSLNASFVKRFSSLQLGSAIFSRGGRSSSAKDYIFIKSGIYNKDNPLVCLFYQGDSKVCDIYLEKKEFNTP